MKDHEKILRDGTHVYFLSGRQATKEEYEAYYPPLVRLELTGAPALQQWKKPMAMDSLAVHPDDVQQAMETDRKHGLQIDYTQDGRPLIHSEQQKRDYLKARGEQMGGKLHDRNSYL